LTQRGTDPTQLGRLSGDALQDILSIARKMKSDISYLKMAMAAMHLGYWVKGLNNESAGL
jgi:hypothetical protein